ncbi:MAG: alpha/beta hydrolase [Saprospiraceae bacterium]
MKFFSKKNLLILSVIGLIFWMCGSLLGSKIATRAHPQKIPSFQKYFSQTVENQLFKSFDQLEISSWFIPNDTSTKAIILLSGIRGILLCVISRAKFYLQKGFNVLMPDLRGTGESGGDLISFGWKERFDLLASVDLLKKKGMDKIAVHGMSLGAATIVYSFQEKPNYDFVVLESCYDNITNALKNRVDKYPIPSFAFYPMTKFTEMRVEASSEDLSPEKYIGLNKSPIFILAGDAEKKVKKEETEKLFLKCNSITKQLHFFKNAYHEDFMNRYEEEWKDEMEKWLMRVSS